MISLDYPPSIDHEDLEGYVFMEPYQDYPRPKIKDEDIFADYVPERCPIMAMESHELGMKFLNEAIVLFKRFWKEIETIPKHELKSLFPVVVATDEFLEALIKQDITCNSSLLDCRDYLSLPVTDPCVYPENYIKGLKSRIEHSVMYLSSKRDMLVYIEKYKGTAEEFEARIKEVEAEADAERRAREQAEARADAEQKTREQAESEANAERKKRQLAEARANKEKRTKEKAAKKKELVEEKLSGQNNSKHLPTLHGKASDNIANMVGVPIIETIDDCGTMEFNGVYLTLGNINSLKGKLSLSTHKLLNVAIAEFTAINDTDDGRELSSSTVKIDRDEYAILCGYNIYEQATSTEEDATKEKARVKVEIDNVTAKIRKDLAILYGMSLSWKENVKKKNTDLRDTRVVQGKSIKNGVIEIEFGTKFANYLMLLPITQFPKVLLKLDERSRNAYKIGLKMSTHYNMDNNIKQGTNDRLKVKTLLNVAGFPTLDTLKKQRASWEYRIKDPFEENLDKLKKCGLISDWYYCHSKGIAMTDEEATLFPDFQTWENTLISFKMQNPVNHEERYDNAKKKK